MQMRDCVLCLPLTLSSETRLGLVLTPFVVSMVSRLMGCSSVGCMNLTGMRYKDLEVSEVSRRLEQFQRLMGRLGTPIDRYWNDNNSNHVARLQSYCETLVSAGKLQSGITPRLICNCGAVEILENSIDPELMVNHKVIQQRSGHLFCKLCDYKLETIQGPSLLLESQFGSSEFAVYPKFYEKELWAMQKEFIQPILVSRQKKSGVSVSLFGSDWQLDTDFCWSFLFCSLIEDGLKPKAVVVSNRSLKPFVWSLGISRKLSESLKDTALIVTPFIRFPTGSESTNWTVSQLIDRYGSPVVRLLLGSMLRWSQKEVTLNSSTVFWGLRALERGPTAMSSSFDAELPSLQEALNMMDGGRVDQLVAELRKSGNVQMSRYWDLLIGKGAP